MLKTFQIKIMKNCWVIVFVFITLLYFGCKPKSSPTTNYVSDEIVLKIGKFEVSRYEFEEHRKRGRKQRLKSEDYQQWLKEYIDENYLLTDAYAKEYDTLSDIIKTVDYASASMIGQVDGYLWQKEEKPKLVFSNRQLRKTYRKRKNTYVLEYVNFPDRETMVEYMGQDTMIASVKEFSRLVKICKTDPSIRSNQADFLYPFYELWPFKDMLYDLKPGNITGPLCSGDKIWIVHIVDIKPSEKVSFKKVVAQLRSSMELAKTLQIVDNKQKKVFGEAKMVINKEILDDVFPLVDKKPKQQITDPLAREILMEYTLENERKKITVGDFLDYCIYDPFVFGMEDEKEIIQQLKDYIIKKYLYLEADSLGVTHDKAFVLDRRRFTNRIVLKRYIDNEFMKKISVTDQELTDFYEQNKENFTEAKTCYISVYAFKDKQTAFSNYSYMASQFSEGGEGIHNTIDTSILKGLVSYHPNEVVERENSTYSDEAIKMIFGSPLNQLSIPLENKNSVFLFVKKQEDGRIIKSLDSMRDILVGTIKNQKEADLMKQRVRELENKYSLEIQKI